VGDQKQEQEIGYVDMEDGGIYVVEDEGPDEEDEGRVGDQEQGQECWYRDMAEKGNERRRSKGGG
jgi:hypothetical protein